ncbi:hypothetical protein NIES2135_32340 [Leptolyngbya boryana NIES-2135]|jgi:hypothetical protein|uniref:Uncharacterized protein n=1 Tax=Leptolyngbya boryana NIES-2135 TaxID=1973484 RepID=A0A1Z4JIA6_LEPBY|nr:hypothetical protein LBWT_33600 [Leptolyngbya boryana IAM M-101]BAS63751.1 hypothetical protein LBDG_33600 [Leptolyngbya boryana dg5]BAY56403.1 hypothetical protein NIES2135_32340 [Leptolyngbya boryana NIES-2135]
MISLIGLVIATYTVPRLLTEVLNDKNSNVSRGVFTLFFTLNLAASGFLVIKVFESQKAPNNPLGIERLPMNS